ncbi:hypothetical protein DFH11DRAFT_1878146 [Phellopilus nigrolimitatus]|nr:hypothetical protein DFH11DRAFT_1878146 [Phellopilus nigrolimitatus]
MSIEFWPVRAWLCIYQYSPKRLVFFAKYRRCLKFILAILQYLRAALSALSHLGRPYALHSKTKRTSPFDYVPVELVQEIFKQYAYERDAFSTPMEYTQSVLQPTLAAIARVSTTWHEVATGLLFRDISISSTTALSSLSSILSSKRHLALQVRSFYFPNISISLESVTGPAKAFCHPNEVTYNLDTVYWVCPNLHSQDIEFEGTKALLELEDRRMLTRLPFPATYLHQLTRLEISLRDCEQHLTKVLFSPSFVFPTLEELVLSVSQSYPRLQAGQPRCAPDCPHDPVELFQAPRLRHLCIRKWRHVHSIRLPTGLQALRSLDVISADFGNEFWDRLRHFASSLESLVLTSPKCIFLSSGSPNDPAGVLSSLTSLTALCVPMQTFAAWNVNGTILVLPPRLRRLTLTGCPYRCLYAEEYVFEPTRAALRNLFLKRFGCTLPQLRSVYICARRTEDADLHVSTSLFQVDEAMAVIARYTGVELLGVVVAEKKKTSETPRPNLCANHRCCID